MNGRPSPRRSSALLPMLAGAVLAGLFTALGFWQLDRAEQKRALQASFDADEGYVTLADGASYPLYQRVTASGRYLGDRQFLLDNIVLDGRLGYYVITPFEYAAGKPLLLVNRGWIAREADDRPLSLEVGGREQAINGRVGRLPRVAIRPGTAFDDAPAGWPRHAVWPELDELAAALDRAVLPFVLLADPDPASPLLRQWQPREIGPMRHIGYAVQWFALALAVVVTGIVLLRRKRGSP